MTPSKNSPRTGQSGVPFNSARHRGRSTYCLFITAVTFLVLADATSAPSRFLGEGPTTSSIPSGGKIRPVYGVCQEQNTIYCTISYDALLFRLSCSFLVF